MKKPREIMLNKGSHQLVIAIETTYAITMSFTVIYLTSMKYPLNYMDCFSCFRNFCFGLSLCVSLCLSVCRSLIRSFILSLCYFFFFKFQSAWDQHFGRTINLQCRQKQSLVCRVYRAESDKSEIRNYQSVRQKTCRPTERDEEETRRLSLSLELKANEKI